MNKYSKSPSLNNIQFDEDWSSHPAIEWLSAHKNILLWAFFGLVATLIIVSRLIAWRTLDAEKDFFQIQTAFTQFQQAAITPTDSSTAAADLEQLKALMQQHPELKPKYEGPLAQTLLINGQIPEAQIFIEDIFKRTQPDHLQFYQDYTQTSLLIGQGHYADALERAEQLKSSLDQLAEGVNPILYVFNLIRLAMLYQQTHQPQAEWNAWEELQNQPQRMEAVLTASQVLKIGNASLNQYIEERKNVLTP
jgi:hypothetical protein